MSALTSIHVCKCNFLPFQNKDICSDPKHTFLKTNLSCVLTCEKYVEYNERCKAFTAHLGHTVCRALDHFFLSSGNSCHRCLMWAMQLTTVTSTHSFQMYHAISKPRSTKQHCGLGGGNTD